jgi:hypothetical protein
MEKSWRMATSIAVCCLALTACTGQTRHNTPAKRIPPDPATQRLDEQERANRMQAEDEARGLLERAPIPPGAVQLNMAPTELLGAELGIPVYGTYLELARYWRIPMSFKAADDYVRQHPPAGLAGGGSSSATRQGMTMHGYAWDGQVLPFSQGGQLSIEVAGSVAAAAGSDVSYLGVVASSPWLDPHPIRRHPPVQAQPHGDVQAVDHVVTQRALVPHAHRLACRQRVLSQHRHQLVRRDRPVLPGTAVGHPVEPPAGLGQLGQEPRRRVGVEHLHVRHHLTHPPARAQRRGVPGLVRQATQQGGQLSPLGGDQVLQPGVGHRRYLQLSHLTARPR